MTYEQALGFWYGRINYEQRSPRAEDLKLEDMRNLLSALGNPHDRLRIVHVAGSKGKGSTSAMLASILREAGYRAGLFTSPHLVNVEERIQVDGEAISRRELTSLLKEVEGVVVAGGLSPTFFEVATAVGFLHFVRRRVDVAIVEVGLGGRFDSTNVCMPLISVITSISLDHTQLLGDTIASIAAEKAGIIKPGRPVVSGARTPAARQTIAGIAHRRQAPLWQLGVDFDYAYRPADVSQEANASGLLAWERPEVQVTIWGRTGEPVKLGLLGEHQAANSAVALACVQRLRLTGMEIPTAAVPRGLETVQWPARLEIVGRRPLILLDCAHNVASAEALVETLRTTFAQFSRGGTRRVLVFACSNDKDLPGILRVLSAHFTHMFLTRYSHSARAVPPERLAQVLRDVGAVPCQIVPAAPEAWHAARACAGPDDLICVTGSVFLAGELRPLMSALDPVSPGKPGRAW